MKHTRAFGLGGKVTAMDISRSVVWLVLGIACSLTDRVGGISVCPSPVPHGCTCGVTKGDLTSFSDDNDVSVQCIDTALTSVPDDLYPSATSMHFKGNNITIIQSVPYSYLTSLVMDNNNIVEIQKGAFQNLSKLTSLSLNDNNISHIDAEIFIGLHSLVTLSLKNNPLNSLEDKTFVGTDLFRVQVIELDNCNLTSISSTAFVGMKSLTELHLVGNFLHKNLGFITSQCMPKLHTLNLSGCSILDLEDSSFEDMHDLTTLDLSNNKLLSLSKESFTGLSGLKTLRLDHNSLRTINPETFANLENLEVLGLSHNQFDSLSKDTISNMNLRSLALHDNPWNCNCSIDWMRHDEVVIDNNYNHSFVCHNPAELVNKDFFLIPANKWNCEADKQESFSGHNTATVVLGLLAALAGAALISLLLYRYILRKRLSRHTVATISDSSLPYRRVNDQGLGMS